MGLINNNLIDFHFNLVSKEIECDSHPVKIRNKRTNKITLFLGKNRTRD